MKISLRSSEAAATMMLSGPNFPARGLTQFRTFSQWQRSGQMLMRPTSRSRKTLARLPAPTNKIAAQTTGAMIGIMTIAVMIGTMTTVTALTTIVIGVGRMTLGGGRAATDQLITPSMPSSQRPSAIMRMPIPMSFRVPA
jgi:hypothetical protein